MLSTLIYGCLLFASSYWLQYRLFSPWIFSGLSIMKLPFHTTEKSTGSSLIFIPSYKYWKTKDGERERERGGVGGGRKETKREEGFDVWELESPWVLAEAVLACPSNITPKLHHPIIRELTKWETKRNGTARQEPELSSWPLEMLSLTACFSLNSSLTFKERVCMWERERL